MNKECQALWMGIMITVGSAAPSAAQDDIPLLRPEEKEVIERQQADVIKAITPTLEQASASTVRVWEKRRLRAGSYLAYGTVVGDGTRVLTKWSEVRSSPPGSLLVQSAQGDAMPANIAKVYADQDLALLEFEGEPLKPVEWSNQQPTLGSFLAATQPNGQLAGFGVLSVRERSLRASDKAFLGVVADRNFAGPGVLVEKVTKDGAAIKAGVEPGDIILQVGERKISGFMELRNALLPIEPGHKATLLVQRGENVDELTVELGSRPEYPNLLGPRLRQMEQFGTEISRVRDSFSNVIQTDMHLQPNQMGGPVVNLQGEVIGVSLARADRTRSFLMSAPAVREMLEKDGQNPELAMAELEEKIRQAQANQAPESLLPPLTPMGERPLAPSQVEGHIEQLELLRALLEQEMEALER